MSALIPTGNLASNFAGYALYTHHQHEKAVTQALAARSFEAFLPVYRVIHYWKDRTKQLSLPVFSCYVSIRGGIDRRLEGITIPGIHSFVGMGSRPAPTPDVDIAALQRTVTSLACVEPHPFVKSGNSAVITRSDFAAQAVEQKGKCLDSAKQGTLWKFVMVLCRAHRQKHA